MLLIKDLAPIKKKGALAINIAVIAIVVAGYKFWITLFGENELLETANFVGTYVLAPMTLILAIAFIAYLLWYFTVHIPKKAIAFLRRKL